MAYGIIEYDKHGNPICEVCQRGYARVCSHVRQKHGMTAREYKHKFGFDQVKGIASQESHILARRRVMENYDLVVTKNLVKNGKKTRFKKGDPGRTRDQVSEETRIRLEIQGKRISKLRNKK